MFRIVLLFAAVALAQAIVPVPAAYPAYGGHGLVTPAVTSQHSNILRSYGNLGQISTYSKTIDTPYSSVSKSDVRVSNPGYAVAAHAAYPAAYHSPLAHTYAAPLAHAAYAPAVAHAAYAPAVAHAAYAPAVAHHAYAPAVAHAAYAHAPVVAKAVAPAGGLLGVAYSAAPAVAHMSYSSGLGYNYAW
ncbi:pupal cuticle protein C1B-like isoform X2 [Phlebotomus argentipes]|uniref:pupal cuticle protein C1B-like isoform X2 n=1 Tax=Phlebotomus argentipes TaxID=94469 RepID=UPI002893710D|nr:pupal cuticle protein C1B-like isoform X2 [Phlebotomus argentipes]